METGVSGMPAVDSGNNPVSGRGQDNNKQKANKETLDNIMLFPIH